MRKVALALVLSLIAVTPALAVQPDEVLPDHAMETRARVLSRELRCMVCQNQSIDDSDAPLARDLRILVRDRLKAGDSDDAVLDFLVARYGEFVLLKPRLSWRTLILWLAPLGLLAGGVVATGLFWRRRRGPETAAEESLTPAEVRRLAEFDSPPAR